MNRYGPAWVRLALRPMADQFAAFITPAPGALVLDAGDDEGATARAFTARGVRVERLTRPSRDTVTDNRGSTPDAVAVVGLFGGIDPVPALGELSRKSGIGIDRCHLAAWTQAPHEDAVRDVFGLAPRSSRVPAENHAREVLRLDAVDDVWGAALERSDIGARLAQLTPGQIARARDSLGVHLAQFAMHDGSLRIPVVMSFWRGPSGPTPAFR